MAIPEPKKKESKKKYIKRCTEVMKSLGRPKDQAETLCRTRWEKGDVSTRKLFERIDRIVGEEEDKYLTKKQKKLPEKLKKKIIASKKKKGDKVEEDVGLTGCPDCGSSINTKVSPVACSASCGWYQKRSYSFKRGTPGRKKRKPRK